MESVIVIPTRGIALLPEVVPEREEVFRVGDPLRLVRPDESEEFVSIDGFNVAKAFKGPPQLLVFLKDRSEADIPVGTEVWSVR